MNDFNVFGDAFSTLFGLILKPKTSPGRVFLLEVDFQGSTPPVLEGSGQGLERF